MRTVVRLLTAVERTERQDRTLTRVRTECARTDARFREQGIDLAVSISQALDEVADGTPSTDLCPSYSYAFYLTVAAHFSDPTDLGAWRRPSWFHAMDDELARHGVPADLLPGTFLFSGPPLRLPHPGDAVPAIGTLPTRRAAALADAYTRVLDRLDPEFRGAARRFADAMRFEAEQWDSARRLGTNPDTLLFWFH
ncbi:hypothetical protein QNO09_31845 [Streptomyces sp. 378]|uniref:DUF7691 family protein n=1 Tax=Streptomyces sp. 378 TaxID=3049412 RepID=UPI0024C2AF4E|nr:hypothetical protein [Streptomyces sp. 378]MDK1347797.1 hypothetical protein [Streptomyces sp. 378]